MANTEGGLGEKRDRSPSFPAFDLGKAVRRTRELFDKARRHEARVTDAAADWGYSGKSSSTIQTVATLLSYGLIESSGSNEARKIKVSELGWRILEDTRPGVREKLLAEAALKPKMIAEYAEKWRDGRPEGTHAISQLKVESGLTDDTAPKFLRVFDEAIRFSSAADSDKKADGGGSGEAPIDPPAVDKAKAEPEAHKASSHRPLPHKQKGILMDGERELTTGLLSKGASFRLIVSGKIGEKEIDRLIRKLELDKEILADTDDQDDNDEDGDKAINQ